MRSATIQQRAMELSSFQQSRIEEKRKRCRKAFEQSYNQLLEHLTASGIAYAVHGDLYSTSIRFSSRRLRAAIGFTLSEYGVISNQQGSRITPEALIQTLANWERKTLLRRRRCIRLRLCALLVFGSIFLANYLISLYMPQPVVPQFCVSIVLLVAVAMLVQQSRHVRADPDQ